MFLGSSYCPESEAYLALCAQHSRETNPRLFTGGKNVACAPAFLDTPVGLVSLLKPQW